VHGRLAAWVALPRPAGPGAVGADNGRIRLAPAAVADALTTALMLLSLDRIATLCEQSPGLEAWILPDGASTDVLHFTGHTTSGQTTPGDD
jgi:hypothetical protein